MRNLKTIEKKVRAVLEKNEDARNDDMVLYLALCNACLKDAGAMPLAEIMTQHKYLGLPSFESVSRTRRKLQAQYRALLKDVDDLPKELRGLIYKSCQSHFTTKCLVIWAERVVNGLALFTETHMDQPEENIGKLCQALAINLDKMTYMEYMNNKLIEAVPWIAQFGVFPNPFNMSSMQKPAIGTQNVGLDVGLAELIKAIALEMNSDKEEIQYESIKDEESDVGAVRDVYYKMVQSWYVSSEFEEYTTNTYSKGASAWKNWAEKIESGEMEGKDAIVAFYEKQLAEAKLEVMALEQRLEAIKNDEPAIFPVTAEEIEDINDAYVEYFGDKYGKQTDNHRYADVYIGQMLWAFLTQENF